jgi:hypothetical protein
MSGVPEDIKKLLDPREHSAPITGPFQYLWVYDPATDKLTVEHNQGKHPAFRKTHKDLEPNAHPDAVRGLAFRIKGGWRIMDRDCHEVTDPFIVKRVLAKLKGEADPEPQPHPRYHGLPDITT